MRLTDADALLEKQWATESESRFDRIILVVSAKDIMSAPVIDLVKCGECKYWKKVTDKDGESWEVCNKHMIFTKADDFCSYGEREDE